MNVSLCGLLCTRARGCERNVLVSLSPLGAKVQMYLIIAVQVWVSPIPIIVLTTQNALTDWQNIIRRSPPSSQKFLLKKAKATTRLYALPMTKVINRNIGSWCNQHSLCNISGLNTDIQDRMLISIATNWTGTPYCLFFSLIQAKVEPINLPRPFVALVKQQRESGYENKLVLLKIEWKEDHYSIGTS